MTGDERDQFREMTEGMPELHNPGRRPERSLAATVFLLLAVISLFGGVILALYYLSWKMFVIGFVGCMGLVSAAAVVERKPR